MGWNWKYHFPWWIQLTVMLDALHQQELRRMGYIILHALWWYNLEEFSLLVGLICLDFVWSKQPLDKWMEVYQLNQL